MNVIDQLKKLYFLYTDLEGLTIYYLKPFLKRNDLSKILFKPRWDIEDG